MPATTNKGFIDPAINDSGWGITLNTLFDAIDTAFGGTTTISGLTTGTTTMTSAQYAPPIIKLSGTLTGNVIVSLPAGIGGFWYVYNGCTGSFTVTFASNGVNGQVLRQGFWSALISDGTNIYFQSNAPASASGSSTQIQYNNGGVLGASSALTYTTNAPSFTASVPASSNVMTTNTPTGGTIVVGMTITGLAGLTAPVKVIAVNGANTYTLNRTNGLTPITGASATGSLTTLNSPNFTGSLIGDAQSATYAGSTSFPVGYLTIPQTTSTTVSSATDGYHVYTNNNITVTGASFSVGDCFVVVNRGTTSITITPGTATTLRLAGSTTAVTTRTIAAYGQAVVLCVEQTTSPASNIFFVSGQGVT
jgi:hypothetical protein